jgi:hypothetical protein
VADVATHFIGMCDYCRKALVFTSLEAREQWYENHPCEDDE